MDILEKIGQSKVTLDAQEEALKDPETAYWLAHYIKGADVKRFQEAACRSPFWAYKFARDIVSADIEKCQEAACRDPEEAFWFARWVPGADMVKCIEACKGTVWEDRLSKLLMEWALL